MKMSELPKGTVIELANGEQYELAADWQDVAVAESVSRDAFDDQADVKIISLPYEITLYLAKWLDASYPDRINRGTPEDLISEAIQFVQDQK